MPWGLIRLRAQTETEKKIILFLLDLITWMLIEHVSLPLFFQISLLIYDVKFLLFFAFQTRSCRGRSVKTSDFHTGGPRFEPRPGSSALGQGALSSLPSLLEETLSRRSRV